MKTILVLPGTQWQIALVKKIKKMGMRVLIVDPNSTAACLKYADGYLLSDIFDWEKVLTYARNEKVDAVLSDECDIAMPVIARLGSALNLPALSVEMAELYTDKFKMRDFCRSHNLNTPEFQQCATAIEAKDFLRCLGRPIMLKPLDSNASHGVFKVKDEDEIDAYFAKSLFFSRSNKIVLAERFIQGPEFTVDGIKTPQQHYTLAISIKSHFPHNPSIANQLLFSYTHPEYDYDLLRQTNDKFILASGLKWGFTHAEYIWENGEYLLVEIAARGGGNMISSHITKFLSGYDTYSYLINCALGEVENQSFTIHENLKKRAAVLKFFDTPGQGGNVKCLQGEDYLQSENDILEYSLNFQLGDHIENCASDSARIGFYIACSESIEKLRKVMNSVDMHFHIELDGKKEI